MAFVKETESFVGSQIRLDGIAPRKTYPSRYVRLVLGTMDWDHVSGAYKKESSIHSLDAATARILGKALIAEAKMIDATKRR
jgi:hypothetical protein